jgi:hypothetical protein
MVSVELDEASLEKPDVPPLPKEVLEQRRQARDDINALIAAIETHKSKHNDELPETLAALTEGEEPILKELKKDPWGNAYEYQKRSLTTFAITSIGSEQGGPISSEEFAHEDELAARTQAWDAYEKKLAEGKKTVESLTKRFGPWYYVIDAQSYSKLKLNRDSLAKPKTPPSEEPALPGLPDLPLPPGEGR